MLPVTDYANLNEKDREQISQKLAMLRSLGDIVPWSLAQKTDIYSVITQDEYTHDVIVPLPSKVVLVFDTT